MLTNLQRVFAGDVQKLLGSAVKVVDLMGEVVDLGLGIEARECSQDTGDSS